MRILQIHNYYQIPGGEDVVVQAEKEMLERRKHEVFLLKLHNKEITNFFTKVKTALFTVYSPSAKRLVAKTIKTFNPDIVHVHNFFPLFSPSIYRACKQAGKPVVQTLHNYRLLCLNGLLLRNNKPCEDCIGKTIPWPGIIHRCYRHSLPGSTTVAAMLSFHNTLRTWQKMVDTFIVLSSFACSKVIEGGLPADKIVVKPNFVYPDPGPGICKGNFALFVGRLSEEKGILNLLSCWKHLSKKIPLKIIGNGPVADKVQSIQRDIPEVEYLGLQPREQVTSMMKQAALLIFPSLWYENCPMVLLEALACGLPVIATDLGSIPAILDPDGENNAPFFDPKTPLELGTKIEWLLSHSDRVQDLRSKARQTFEKHYTEDTNYQELIKVYEKSRP